MDMYYPAELGFEPPPAIVIAASATDRERVMGVCCPVGNVYEGQGDGFSSSPGFAVRQYFILQGESPLSQPPRFATEDARIVVQPEHGLLIMNRDDEGIFHLGYRPTVAGYFGKDRFEVLAHLEDKPPVRIVFYMILQERMADGLDDDEFKKFCPKKQWVISAPSPENYDTPDSWYRATSLQALAEGKMGRLGGPKSEK